MSSYQPVYSFFFANSSTTQPETHTYFNHHGATVTTHYKQTNVHIFFCSTKFQLLSAPGGLAVAQTLISIFLLIIFYLFQFPSVEFLRVTADLPVFIANSDSLMVQKNKRGESLAWIFYFYFILQHKGS